MCSRSGRVAKMHMLLLNEWRVRVLSTVNRRRDGFTIVELLIVIVVIAILAAITIVSYNGVVGKAHEASLMSELSQAYEKIELYKQSTGLSAYPQTIEDADVRLNATTSFFYTPNANATSYCLSAVNQGQKYYFVTPSTGSVREGKCTLTVATYVGSGTAGRLDGTGTAAQLNNPTGAAFAPSGELYIADYGNNSIRKVTTSGAVSIFAGLSSGASGSTNGVGTAASFYAPGGIAVDYAGVIYVADQFNSRIRKIALDGTVSTLAGSSTGYLDSTTGTSAKFYWPWGLAVDASGNVYVADTYNNMIRKITPSGSVSTIAGTTSAGFANGSGSAARFNYPSGIAIGPDGVLYVADQDNNRIRKVTTSGDVTTLAGSGTKGTVDGLSTAAQFASPHGIAVDVHSNVYVADEYSHSIRKIAPDGSVYTLAGSAEGYQDGSSDVARFSHPLGLATSSTGNLYIVERGNNRIRTILY